MPPPRTPASPSPGYDLLFKVIIGLSAAGLCAGTAAWLFASLANILTGHGGWASWQPFIVLIYPEQVWPGLSRAWLITTVYVLPGLALAAAGCAAVALGRRFQGRKTSRKGLARRGDLTALLPKPAAIRARQLRPSLAATPVRKLPADERGLLLGTLQPAGQEVRGSWEDVFLLIMAPRAGKTSAIAIPAMLRAPGAVMLTSNKAARDAYTATLTPRGERGAVWSLDPQQIAHAPQQMWWDILADAGDLPGARRLAGHFVTASVNESSQGDFWSTAAQNTLTALFLAASTADRPITDVLSWLASPADRTPIDLLHDAGFPAVAEQLQGTVAGAVETRDGIFETARQYAACLLDPGVARWVTPTKRFPQFRPDRFATSSDTLYLLSKDGGGSASAIIAACADAVMRQAVVQAERAGGRLERPLLAILDEAANVCKISDLPELYSHLGSRGVIPVTILQSYRQGVRVWGEAGMDALWSAATIKLIGSGIDDADFADKLSRLVGDHEVEAVSTTASESGTSRSISTRTERVLPADAVRALPKGSALLLATGIRPALIDLKPWYTEPDATRLGAASDAATAAITQRANRKPGPGDFGNLA